jgi:hypothetical protein
MPTTWCAECGAYVGHNPHDVHHVPLDVAVRPAQVDVRQARFSVIARLGSRALLGLSSFTIRRTSSVQ